MKLHYGAGHHYMPEVARTHGIVLQFCHSVMSNSLRPQQRLQHARLLCPSPTIFPSIRVFSNKSVLCIRWPKYWHFSFSPSNEYSVLISFRIDWLALLAVQGTLKSLLHTSSLNICMYMYIYLSKVSKNYPKLSKNRLLIFSL